MSITVDTIHQARLLNRIGTASRQANDAAKKLADETAQIMYHLADGTASHLAMHGTTDTAAQLDRAMTERNSYMVMAFEMEIPEDVVAQVATGEYVNIEVQ